VKRILNPLANLIGVAEATCADLLFELFNLMRSKLAGIALEVKGTEGFESFVTKDTNPFAQSAEADPSNSATPSRGLPAATARTAVRRW
jgi:hypothetical protein